MRQSRLGEYRPVAGLEREPTMSIDLSKERRSRSDSGSPSAPSDSLVEVLSRSQQSYRELIDNLDQAVFTLSLKGEIRVANRRLAEIFGVSFRDLIGRSVADFVESPTVADIERMFSAVEKKGSWQGILPVRLKHEQQERHFSCWAQPVVEDGRVTAITGWARDVTTEHESEIRFTELFESLREGIFFTTPDGEVLDANPALVRMLGYESKTELQHRNFREVYANRDDRDAVIKELEEKGSVQDRELVFQRKDGTRIHCLASGFAIRDASGRVVRAQGTLVDVTERLEMQRRLHQEQEFVRRLVASFPDVIAVLDRDGRYTYVSQRIQEVLGRRPEDYVGEELGARAHPEDKQRLAEELRKLLSGEKVQLQVEFRTPAQDGTWRLLRASAGPLFDDTGRISGVVASARDVTESNRIERQLSQKEKFAAMGQMLAGAAHELNNPLTAILGVGDLLRERATDAAARRHAEIVLQQARRAAEIVQNLLAFSRPLSQGGSKIRLTEVVQHVLQLQREPLRLKNIEVRFKAPDDLPAVTGDRKLLTQAFLNIITNAEQAVSSVRDHGTLQVSLSAEGQKVCAAFSDDGPGIPTENVQMIFDPFYTTKRPGGGSGLGLTICLAVVKEHGGTIEVQSNEGGATFRVLLPAAPAEPASNPLSGGKSSYARTEVLRGRSVLVVDDEESIREIVQEGLAARGVKVDCAANSEEALLLLPTQPYEFVLCDFNLPGLHGQQLFERLRTTASDSSPRFVFMTGDLVEPATVAAFREKGAQILQKPFHVSALAALLAELLQPQTAEK
jgi:PAS domain S-box-containing protein